MGRAYAFRASGEADCAELSEETVINGAPYAAQNANRSGTEEPAVLVDRPEAQISEEIKRRQISLLVHYVSAVRAR
jgi:hypothetical protein